MWQMSGTAEEDRLNAAQTKQVLRRTLRLAAPYKRDLMISGVLIICWTMTNLANPLIVRHGIDEGIRKDDTGALNWSVAAYIVVTIFSYWMTRTQLMTVSRGGEGFLRELRLKVFERMQIQSMAFYDREKAGVLVARMTSDIDSMSELVQFGLQYFVASALLICLTIVLLLALSWQLALVCLISFPIIVIASVRFQRQSNEIYLTVRERVGANLSAMQESLAGVRVIQAYAREDEQSRRFSVSNRRLFDSHLHSVRVSVWYFGLVEFAGIATQAGVVGIGGWLVHRGDVEIGTVVAFVLLLSNLFEPIQQLSQLFNTVQSAGASLNKLYKIIDAEPDVGEHEHAVALPASGDLVVEGATFSYESANRPAVEQIDLRIADGERIALVGPTGAGKSTVAKLIARMYDPTVGRVSFGGVDLRDATMLSLRDRIIVVPQEGYLFSGTIRDNIRIARPSATDEEIVGAAEAIGALERFEAFPDGLDTEVRERGSRLSAGERQLVSLARAALVDPAVMVLDEATSNLDPGTEVVVERAMEHLMQGRTTIVVAHRLSTVQRADRIAVIDHGQLVELGSHAELVAEGGRYAALAAAWAAGQSAGQPAAEAGNGSMPLHGSAASDELPSE
jgi:ATP-binding cassette, subfamily B, bacterial